IDRRRRSRPRPWCPPCSPPRPPGPSLQQREQYSEIRQTRPTLAFNQTPVLLHKRLGKWQAEPAAAFPSCNQGKEDAIEQATWYSRSIVDDMQFQCQLMPDPGNDHMPGNPGAQPDDALACQRLRGIAHQVEQCLDQLLLVGYQLRQAGVVVALDDESLRILRE